MNQFYFTRFISDATNTPFNIPDSSPSSNQILIYQFNLNPASSSKMYCQGVKAKDDVTFFVAMISNTVADGMAV